jgi:hypothetical protein
MRFSLTAASCAVVISALLAGCTNGVQSASSLPLSSTGATQAEHVFNPGMKMPHGPMALLKMQAEGKMAGPVPARVLQKQLAMLQKQPHMHFNVRRDATAPAMWTSLTDYDAILGLNKKGTKVNSAINTENNGCYDPISLKVDGSQNLWAACEELEYDEDYGGLQEYSSTGSFTAQYNQGCPSPVSTCEYFYGYSFDGAVNANNVFSACTFCEYETETTFTYGGAFEYWSNGGYSSPPTLIWASPYGEPVYDVYYMDVDSSGNIWFDYYGCESECGYGLGEVTNPTSSPSFKDIEAPPFLSYGGGVYASNGGNTINVIDQDTHMIYQFNTSGSEIGQLGPTAFGIGDPVSGGYNSNDSKFAIADADAWLNIGNVGSNKWKVVKASLMVSSLEGAAYSPSDK